MIKIKDIVKDGKLATFSHYNDGNLWYITNDEKYVFLVPISDIGDATFLVSDKCMFLMRWIRKNLEHLVSIKEVTFETDDTVVFLHYRDGDLWYNDINNAIQFPIPISKIEDGEIYSRIEKRSHVESYIKVHLDMLKISKLEQVT